MEKRKEKRTRSWSAIQDDRYEKLMRNLSGQEKVCPRDADYKSIQRLVSGGRLRVGELLDPVSGRQMRRVVDAESGKILARLSEIPAILAHFSQLREAPGARALVAAVNQHYCGIGMHHAEDFVCSKDKATRNLVSFQKATLQTPTPSRPMQYIQIDVLEMKPGMMEDQTYSHALIVRCLLSEFIFARALSSRHSPLIPRHLLDIFSVFGPPEAYQTQTEEVLQSVPEVAKMLNVAIENLANDAVAQSGNTEYFRLRKSCEEQAKGLFGEESGWVEALPLALLRRNTTAHPSFAPASLSPFQIMFGRDAAWKDKKLNWQSANRLQKSDEESDCKQSPGKLKGHIRRQKELHGQAEAVVQAARSHPSVFLQVGDEVYVRNFDAAAPGKGVIVDVQRTDECPYRVQLTADVQPEVPSQWFKAADVTAATKDLELKRRNGTEKRRGVCQCSKEECRRPTAPGCRSQMHRLCCRVADDKRCPVHFKPSKSAPAAKRNRRSSSGSLAKKRDTVSAASISDAVEKVASSSHPLLQEQMSVE